MRILRIPEIDTAPAASARAGPSIEQERLESLENIAKSLLQRLEEIETRLVALEKAPRVLSVAPASEPSPTLLPLSQEPPAPWNGLSQPFPLVTVSEPPASERLSAQNPDDTPAPAPAPSAPIAIDPEAVKKGLLTKMWKYMNDEPTTTI